MRYALADHIQDTHDLKFEWKVASTFGKDSVLHNANPVPVYLPLFVGKPLRVPTAEHAMSMMRFESRALQFRILECASRADIRRVVQRHTNEQCRDWNDGLSVRALYYVLRCKYAASRTVRRVLTSFGEDTIVALSKDNFWGAVVKPGLTDPVGANVCGRVWMLIQDDARKESISRRDSISRCDRISSFLGEPLQ